MRKPSGGGSIRKPTDTNQVHLDSINPQVYPDIAKLDPSKLKAGPLAQNTIRAGKSS
jgi:hypothetical protein